MRTPDAEVWGDTDLMTVIRQLEPADWREWRALRLRALGESPEAFGSTLDEVLARDTEEHWREGLSAPMVPFLAEIECAAAGMGRLLLPETAGESAELLSVWVAPEARGRGVGQVLVAAAVDWLSICLPETRLRLAVVEINMPARRLYERCGFVVIGPDPEDEAELLMERPAALRV